MHIGILQLDTLKNIYLLKLFHKIVQVSININEWIISLNTLTNMPLLNKTLINIKIYVLQ